MNVFSISGLSTSISCSILSLIAIVYCNNKVHRMWAVFNLFVSIWGFGVFMAGRATSEEAALLAWRIAFAGALFTCVLFYHTVCFFGELNRKKILIFAYLQGFFFLLLTLTTDLIFSGWHV